MQEKLLTTENTEGTEIKKRILKSKIRDDNLRFSPRALCSLLGDFCVKPLILAAQ